MKLLGQNGIEYNISRNKTIIGRDAKQCQIALDLPFISRLQALIEVDSLKRVTIKNLSSRKTTFVNTKQIDFCTLYHGDKIEFGGKQTISFVFENFDLSKAINHSINISSSNQSVKKVETNSRYQPLSNVKNTYQTSLNNKLRIGRASDNDIVLDLPSVSRYHAELIYEKGNQQPIICDLGSTNGVLINGKILKGQKLLASDEWVTIGGYLLLVQERNIKRQDLSSSRLAAYHVSKNYGGKKVLQDVSIAFYPKEFIGLMGSSGCGKSTLLDALNGMRPASSGKVFINDLDLYQNFDLLRRSIGYVPQKDVLHDALSVESTLYYAAKMRLPSKTASAQIDKVINEVINTIDLEEQRHNAFKELSGGQQKRLSLGIELITKPNFLFLDEPTSPLDPETTENMMLLFRQLANEGRIVVMVTHKFEKFNLMHNIVLLSKGGKLAYFGPPDKALTYFNCKEPSEIYRRLGEKTPEQSNQEFQNSQHYQRYVAKRFNEMKQQVNPNIHPIEDETHKAAERKFGFRQWLILSRRYFEIKLKDLKNTLILLSQAPIIALILVFITDDTPNDGRTIFIASVISIWLGANNAIREVVSETAIYIRERLINLKIPSYVFSKFVILSGIGFFQCFLFTLILTIFDRFKAEDFFMILIILYLTLLAGVSIGLFFSSILSSAEKAMSVLPLILIPQLLLSGFLKPLDDIYVNLKTKKPAVIADYDKYQKKKNDNSKVSPQKTSSKLNISDPIDKQEGLGNISFFSNFITSRWTIDAIIHQVSLNDTQARDKLATQVTVREYKKVLNKKPDNIVIEAYESRVLFDLIVLTVFSLLFLFLTIIALKQRDSL